MGAGSGAQNSEKRHDSPPQVPLFGRDEQVAVLRSSVGRVAGGEPGLVVVNGAPGVGKTRLAREGLALAESSEFLSLAGSAHVLSRDVAYAPLVQALGPLLRSRAPGRLNLLVGDLPQLGVLFSGLGLNPPAPLSDPAVERARLLDGLARLVERLIRERPLALLIDDADAADPGTLAALRYLTAGIADLPLLAIITTRSGDPPDGRGNALATTLGGSPWWVERIALEPLGRAAAEAIVTTILPGIDRQLLSRVVQHCGGHPLFLEAVARGLAERGGWSDRQRHPAREQTLPLPADVRDQLAALVANASTDEAGLLALLAAAGGELEHDVLVRAAGLDGPGLLTCLSGLQRRGLLQPVNDDAYDLAHGLLRDTLLAALSPADAARAHLNLIDAFSAVRADDSRVAEHVLAAGAFVDRGRALRLLRAGAERAQRLGASEDAIRYLSAAADLARNHDRAALPAILDPLAAMCRAIGRREQAARIWNEVVAERGRLGDALGVSRGERELALLAWVRGDLESAAEHLAAAASSLHGLEPSPEHAELLHAQTMFATRLGDTAQVRTNAAALRELSQRLGSRRQSAQAHLAEAIVSFAATDYLAMAASVSRGIEDAKASADPMLLIRAFDQASIAAATQGDAESLRRYSLASLQIGQEAGALALQLWPRCRIAIADLLCGNWDAALRGTSEVLGLCRRLGAETELPRGMVSILASHAWVLVHLGRLAEANACLAEAAELSSPALRADRNIFSMVDTASAMAALAEGDPAAASERAAKLDDLSSGWLPLLSAALRGEALALCGDGCGARHLASRFRAVVSCATPLPTALADWVQGLADSQDGKAEAAAAHLVAASSNFDRLALPFYAARAKLAAAQTGTDPTAVDDGRHALKVFDELGATRYARDARELLRLHGVVPSRGRRRQPTGAPLSARELQVARLVAAGLTNAQVATQLYVSPRTVTTHLDHIYARLELSSRVALTRYLADAGLLDADGPPDSEG